MASRIPAIFRTKLFGGRWVWNGRFALIIAAFLQSSIALAEDFTNLSLKELMSIEVTSVSKRKEQLSGAAGAVYVVTNEDLKRNGIRSVPDALRLVPGLSVAQIDASTWAISSRGSNGRFANKLLVLIDGRTVYTPLFSGVFWDRQDLLIEDIERIEVIRGPGASLWGSNAVNGVLNIITKNAADTQGTYVEAGAGKEENAFLGFRHGETVNDRSYFRVYAKATDHGSGELADGNDGGDEWRGGRAGFRADLNTVGGTQWRLQGEAFSSVGGKKFSVPILTAPYSQERSEDTEVSGGNLLLGFERSQGKDASISGQVYLSHDRLNDARVSERRSTFDVELAQKFAIGNTHLFQWGAGYRESWDRIDGSDNLSFAPVSDTSRLANMFVQDTIRLDGPELTLTVGTKIEYNNYTGLEIQPSARVAWEPDPRQTYWLAVSRAVRTPSRGENHIIANQVTLAPFSANNPTAFPALVRVDGSESIRSERLLAFEAGSRWQIDSTKWIDLATFYNIYDRLIGPTRGTSSLVLTPTPHLVVPSTVSNVGEAASYGVEFFGRWQATDKLLLSGGYTFFEANSEAVDGNNPEHQIRLSASADLDERTAFDVTLRYVDELTALNVDPYTTFDVRLAHKLSDSSSVALVGRNLFSSHFEFGRDGTLTTDPTRVEPSLFLVFEKKL